MRYQISETHHDASVCSQAKNSLRKWRKQTARNNHVIRDFMAGVCEEWQLEAGLMLGMWGITKNQINIKEQQKSNLVRRQVTRTRTSLPWWLTWEETTCSDGLLQMELWTMAGFLPTCLELPQTYHQLLALVLISRPVSERWGCSLIPFSCLLSSSLHWKAF